MDNIYLYLTHESKNAVEKKKHKYSKHDIAFAKQF
ncbi:Rep family protein [Lactiplantibacillus plantarum]